MYKFEWDPEKSTLNKKKHGIYFDEAIEIQQRPCLEISNIAYSKNGESRSATVGIVNGKIYTAIWVNKKNNILQNE